MKKNKSDGNNNAGDNMKVYVSKSGTNWLKSDVNLNEYRFEPHQFIRSHNQKPEDPNTQVWDVAFEPGKSEVVATCGGRFICLLNIRTGALLLRYQHSDHSQNFYSLSWSTLDFGNILASGTDSGEVRLFHLDREVSFYSWTYKSSVSINSVIFHSQEPSWLFTASKDGVICLWDIGNPTPPRYKTQHSALLKVTYQSTIKDLYSMVWQGEAGAGWIMVGTAAGLMGWRIKTQKVREEKFPKTGPKMVEFRLQGVSKELPYIDSVCSLGAKLLAAKSVGHGKIIVFKADFPNLKGDETEVQVENLMEFAWRKTNNFFMNIGGLSNLGLVACGDDKGYIWIYKMPSWLTTEGSEKPRSLPEKVAPLGLFPWPDLENEDGSSQMKEDKQPMINKVAFSPSGNYIVGVTDNNIVAVWKKQTGEESK